MSKAEHYAMAEEAVVDRYDEEERPTGFATMVEDNLTVPFETTVPGVTVTVTGITHTSHGPAADCVSGRNRQPIHLLGLPLPEPPPEDAKWIAAYRHRAR